MYILNLDIVKQNLYLLYLWFLLSKEKSFSMLLYVLNQ